MVEKRSCKECHEIFELAKEGMLKMIKHRRACEVCSGKDEKKCCWRIDKKYRDAINGLGFEYSARLLGCLLVLPKEDKKDGS